MNFEPGDLIYYTYNLKYVYLILRSEDALFDCLVVSANSSDLSIKVGVIMCNVSAEGFHRFWRKL